jgi:hypothetical protein
MFAKKDIQQIKDCGLTVEKVISQIELIKSGMSYSNLIAAANIGNGILKIDEKQQQEYINLFETKRNQLSIVKFVPASGAATRMFKFLFQFLKEHDVNESIETYSERNKEILIFFNGLEKLPFYEDVINKAKELIPNFNELPVNERHLEFVKTMMSEDRLNYSFYPKGLLPFHKYSTQVSTAFEEHLMEATLYASSKGKANLHFTISEVHKKMFKEELEYITEDIENKTNSIFDISFSYQSNSSNTIAITSKDALYREQDGSLLFRPSGHGALIENLNALDFDLIFIKNIDNIVVSDKNKKVSDYKKLIGGILLEVQEKVFISLKVLDKKWISEEEISEIVTFVSVKMNMEIDPNFNNWTLLQKGTYLHNKLNRPIRVCGMVKNEGEPGGGPFWVKDENGHTSLQIIEFAQIDIANKNQKEIVKNATHFNPTDLVCGIKNYKGQKFDLANYIDSKAAFITIKSQNGVDIKALELPGLWNGSMAHWNTIFVEIPVSTFNPVKTVNDLLKPAHQVT